MDNASFFNHAQIIATGTGKAVWGAPYADRESWDIYAIVYLIEGNGFFESKPTGYRRLKAGDALLLQPSIGHRYGPAKGDFWHEIWITFKGEIFDAMFKTSIFNPVDAVVNLPLPLWKQRLESFQGSAREPRFSDRISAACNLQALLVEIASLKEPRLPDWVLLVIELMQESPLGLDFPAVARKSGMSYESFRKQFKALAGDSPAHYHTGIIMRRAYEMLYDGGPRLKEIAAELGFCDEYHFSKRFKEWYGSSPANQMRTRKKSY